MNQLSTNILLTSGAILSTIVSPYLMTKLVIFGKDTLKIFHISILGPSAQETTTIATKFFRIGAIAGAISALFHRFFISYNLLHTQIAFSLGTMSGHIIAILAGAITFYQSLEVMICLATTGASIAAIFYVIKNPQVLMPR